MNANELMMGDWVYHSEDGFTQIGQRDFHDHTKEYWNKFSPIPLTAEILEKNGFKNIDKLGAERCNGFNIYFKDGDGFSFNEHYFSLHYVHEFQHALRLCRLRELADNFKV